MAKKTPLYNEHIKLKARMVEFGGWDMPVIYTNLIEEHKAVRNAAGLCDVSHMGQFEFVGPDAMKAAQNLTTNDISKLVDGQAIYSLLPNEKGTLVDDIIVYRFNPQRIMFVVNAANIDKDWAWVKSHTNGDVKLTNRSDDWALIALQGPKSAEILKPLTDVNLDSMKTFHFAEGSICGHKGCIVARTGYTGEDGFELFCKPSEAPKIWSALIETGKPKGLLPTGLGSRDTLRLEMKYSLYGHEISDQTSPVEAGLSWVIKFNKGDFIGKTAMEKVKADGLKRKLIGFSMVDDGIPRDGYKIFAQNGSEPIGYVTSGTMSPSLSKAIGIGYVPVEFSQKGSKILVDIRGRKRLAEVVETPFYKK